MAYGYATETKNERSARAQGVGLPVSFKQSVEISNYIRGDTLVRAKAKLNAAIAKKSPIPFKRYTGGVGHRKGALAAGRYPVKASSEILKLLNSAEANALFKGLSGKNLILDAIVVKQASSSWRQGRQSRRQMKRAHVEVILAEKETERKEKPATQPSQQSTSPKPQLQTTSLQKSQSSALATNLTAKEAAPKKVQTAPQGVKQVEKQ